MQIIALTGASCAGKTTVLQELKKVFPKEIVVIPEAATIIFSAGPFSYSDYRKMSLKERWQFQEALLLLQKSMEDAFSILPFSPPLSLCERGLLDGAAYIPVEADVFCQHFCLNKESIFHRYTAIIHLESITTGAVEVYRELVNPFCDEIFEEVRAHEYALRAVWQNHPNYHFVSCEGAFQGKIRYVKEFVEKMLKKGGRNEIEEGSSKRH